MSLLSKNQDTYEINWDVRLSELEQNSPETFGNIRGENYEQNVFRLSTMIDYFTILSYCDDINIKYSQLGKNLQIRIEKLIDKLYPRGQ